MLSGYRLVQQHRIVGRFRQAGAIAPENAIALEALHQQHNAAFDNLVIESIVLKTEDGRFYIDAAKAEQVLTRRRQMALVYFLIFAILYAAYLILTPMLILR